jgi:hypothetical protein
MTFLGSSAVEQSTVNRLVAGSNPARGAHKSLGHTQVWSLLLMLPESKALNVPYVRIRKGSSEYFGAKGEQNSRQPILLV